MDADKPCSPRPAAAASRPKINSFIISHSDPRFLFPACFVRPFIPRGLFFLPFQSLPVKVWVIFFLVEVHVAPPGPARALNEHVPREPDVRLMQAAAGDGGCGGGGGGGSLRGPHSRWGEPLPCCTK